MPNTSHIFLVQMPNAYRYAHCMGCEQLLGRDHNICLQCYYEHAEEQNQVKGTPAQISSRHHAPVAKRCYMYTFVTGLEFQAVQATL